MEYNLEGGGNCKLCKSEGTSATTCPWNPDAKNPNPKKHPKAVGENLNTQQSKPKTTKPKTTKPKTTKPKTSKPAEDTGGGGSKDIEQKEPDSEPETEEYNPIYEDNTSDSELVYLMENDKGSELSVVELTLTGKKKQFLLGNGYPENEPVYYNLYDLKQKTF